MRTIEVIAVLCLATSAARADEPPPDEQVRQFADTVEELAELADKVGLDTASHEAARLARSARVAADYVELGLLLAGANEPSALTTYWSASLGGGVVQDPSRDPAGELAVIAGLAIAGPSCTLVDVSGRASYLSSGGPAIAQSGHVCLGAAELESETSTPDSKVEVLALTAHEALGMNVRPSVDAAAITDNGRFWLAEAGISVEGLRWYWSQRRWSVAAPGVAMSQSILSRELAGDRENLARVTAAAWFGELRYHRPRADQPLTDFAMRLFPIAVDAIESGQAISTISLVPLEIIGLGTHGVYIDAAGGVDLTAEDPEDTPGEIAARPDLGVGSWRLALRIGVPRIHGELVSRQRLVPTLGDSAVIDRRTSATLHADVEPVFFDVEAYRAHLRFYAGPGDDVDFEHDTWGVQGEAWVRIGRHVLVGATAEVGRSFVFAEPAPTLGEPPYGYLVLAHVGWRASATRAID